MRIFHSRVKDATQHRRSHFQNAFYGCERDGAGLSGIGRVEQQEDQRHGGAAQVERHQQIEGTAGCTRARGPYGTVWRRRDVVNKRGLERELADLLLEDGLADLVNADGSAVLFLLNPDPRHLQDPRQKMAFVPTDYCGPQ